MGGFSLSILRISNISKQFKMRRIVNDVSFCVESGEIVGLLGPNGAGKTTSFYMVVGLLRPDSGEILLSLGVICSAEKTIFR